MTGAVGTGNSDTSAEGPLLHVPGGALDPSCRPRDVYRSTPREAPADGSAAARIAQSYIGLVNAGRYDEISALFADDGLSLPPNQTVVHGRAALDAFYPQIAQIAPRLIAVGYTSSGNDCFVEIAAEEDVMGERRYVLVAVNHFTVNAAGRATRMITYARAREPVFTLSGE